MDRPCSTTVFWLLYVALLVIELFTKWYSVRDPGTHAPGILNMETN